VLYADVVSRRAWSRWVAGVAAFAVVALIEATLGVNTRSTTDMTYVGMTLVVAIGWPRDRGGSARRAVAAIVYVVLALPLWVVASGATDAWRIVADGGRAVAIVAVWALALATAPVVGPYAGGASLLLAFLPLAPRVGALPAWTAPPTAFASGSSATFAHVTGVLLVVGLALGWKRARRNLIRT